HSDLTRTVAVGKPAARTRKIYQVVADAQRLAIDSAGSGMTGKTLDAVARTFIKKKGYGKYFSHSLGHGLGLQVHEQPRLSALSNDTLVSGNVVTIEPGVYIPDVGGVRIEDDVVICNGYCELLNKAPKELVVL
ncbi:MAG: M24 family metallopeptidase, partial [Bacteroidota bacterium]